MPTSTPAGSESAPLLFTALRILGIVVLLLIVASIVYSGWVALDNWGTIRV